MSSAGCFCAGVQRGTRVSAWEDTLRDFIIIFLLEK